MASLTRGVSFRRQGSSGRSWADNLGLNDAPPRYTSSRQSKGDGITKKTIMVPDSGGDDKLMTMNHSSSNNNNNRSPREDRRKSRPGVFSWLKNRFRKNRS